MYGYSSLSWAIAHALIAVLCVIVGPTYDAQRPRHTLAFRTIILAIAIINLAIALQEAMRYLHLRNPTLWNGLALIGAGGVFLGLSGVYDLWKDSRLERENAPLASDLEETS